MGMWAQKRAHTSLARSAHHTFLLPGGSRDQSCLAHSTLDTGLGSKPLTQIPEPAVAEQEVQGIGCQWIDTHPAPTTCP